ncbi:MAG: MBOAT family protein [Oscillibacter sp.]|nr:MBOAT family protein [Oscillibacter sp.]
MSFTSFPFLLFFGVLLLLYYIVPKRVQWPLLLAGSFLFYAFAGWKAMLYMAATVLSTWFCGGKIGQKYAAHEQWLKENKATADRETRKARKAAAKAAARRWMLAGIFLNFGMLAVVKYTDFLLGNANGIIGLFSGGEETIPLPHFLLPMGISFYIFQSMGYLLDVYRSKYPPQRNLGKFALFVSFFPQLIQGPISRYDALAPSLLAEHKWNTTTAAFGLQRMLWGFFKKLVVADRLMVVVRTLSGSPDEYQGAYVLALMAVYAVTLYADFTGGIDVTIGAAECLGIEVAENFHRPFFSKSTAEYWRRWHITMGSWFRDYIFYPVSISKTMLGWTQKVRAKFGVGAAKRFPVYLATMLTWFVTGVWHGASWNFIVWGLLNGVIILVSQELEPLYARFHERFPKLGKTFGWRLFQVGRTFWLMGAVRVLDCYRDVPVTFRAVGTIFTRLNLAVLWNGSMLKLGASGADWLAAGMGALLMLTVSLVQRRGSVRAQLAEKPLALRWALFGALLLAVAVFGAYGVGFDANQFIYNQF